MKRRTFIQNSTIASGLLVAAPLDMAKTIHEKEAVKKSHPFTFCFNSSTIRGQKLPIEEEIDLVGKAGYDGMEVWIPVLNAYKEKGGKMADLRKRVADHGMRVEDAIGFAQWIHDDEQMRNKALDQLNREMEMLAELGCTRIAAPPAGATDTEISSYDAVADRFSVILDMGLQHGVIPHLELWGFSKTLYKLPQLLYVAAQVGRPEVRLLTDVYHLYKGGSKFEALDLIAPEAIEIFHVNDYPSDADRTVITDAHRIFPGGGIAPFAQILKSLAKGREKVILSLELFNPEYYKMEASAVVKTGLEKMKSVVAKAWEE